MSTPKPLPTFTGEPIASIAVGFSVLFNSVLVAFPLFGLGLDWDQMIALATIFNTALALGTLWQRSKVSPVEKANARIEQAAETGVAKPL